MDNPTRTASSRKVPPLPGTLGNLLDAEDDNYQHAHSSPTASPGPIPRPPPKIEMDPAPPSSQTLPEQVDDFGWTLVAAIRDFRSQVEDIFGEHYQCMKRVEDVHKLSLAKLAAENGQLRERLGLNPGMTLFQNLQFDPLVTNVNEKKKQKSAESQLMAELNKVVKSAAHKGDADDKPLRSGKTQRGVAEPEERRGPRAVVDPLSGGGNWETFVAWVPAGAALMAPQPWKPLAHEVFVPVDPDLKPADDKDEDDEGKKWQVLELWEADKEELEELRQTVEQFKGIMPKGGESSKQLQAVLTDKDGNEDEDNEGIIEVEAPKVLPFMIHPSGSKRIFWDLCSLLMVVYDMIMIPLAMFDLEEGLFIQVMTWATRLFWTLDMPMSLSTGIIMANGTITFDFKFVVKKYLKTWFLLDIFIVASDWIEFIVSVGSTSDDGGGGFGKMARIFRIVRSVRLLRLVRMQSVLQMVTERIQSDKLFLVLNVLKLVVAIVSFAHIVACIWWGIGKRGGNTWAKTWLASNVGVESRYLISLHWTLSQFSGGMEEVRPKGAIERFFVVIIWIVCFMGGCIVVSILTSDLVQTQIIGGSQARQLATLRKYLKQNTISKNLALRVQRSAKYAISGDLSPDAVDLLGVVSDQLRLEMHFEMYSDLFRCHPFFEQCIQVCAQVVRRVCHQATSTLLLDAGDVLFSKGEAPAEPKMFFFFKGTLEYTKPDGEVIVLSEKQWIAEPVLWLQWVHRGQLKAITDIKVSKLDARRFTDIMERFKEVFPAGFNPKVYAHDYANCLNEMQAISPDQVTDLSGLYMP